MNANSQRSLNAGWTRHTNTRPAPQVRPVSITTFAGATFIGTAWVRGSQMGRPALHAEIKTARTAYQETGSTRVFTDTVALYDADERVVVLLYSDIRRISEIA